MPVMLVPQFNEKEAFHRLEDEQFASSDVLGFRTASRMLLTLLLLRTTAIERLYGLATTAAIHSLVLEVLALVASRYPARYAPHRRWLITLAIAHLSATIHLLTINGGMNIFALAGGRPHHLLFWFCIGNGAFYTALCSVHSRLSVSWSWWALPALALLPVLRSGSLCALLMRAPGAELALARLFRVLEMLHRVPLPPLAQLSVRDLPPALQCRVINAWSAVMVGAAVPLAIQAFWELARWQEYQQRRAAAALAAANVGDPAAAALAAVELKEDDGEPWHSLVPTGHCMPVEVLLFSSLVWSIAALVLT
ncbi:hypothetical protein C2E21_4419 [Chlorella sorokiniana]|uniref:Uncharacterized protein n=1 Tax=Chlorella sorokiniana TaxID=3076 RepID=A0A2P6TRI1_CHLSO|nr:hypothetical protein C2E21_4419 [Chlorella sorokiniana]|eukprot:PRW56673.1 hypothetical protein C2E21_4419 [Chlorella sorokiniana]